MKGVCPMAPDATIEKIHTIKKTLGRKLIILTHHYQHPEIVALGDYAGDSFGLSQRAAADSEARHIVFCGVHFMAESAAILSQPHQTVQIPNLKAGCWMADMADAHIAQQAWDAVTGLVGEQTVMPLVYMNSDAAVKALCGRHGGAVCTSSNAGDAFAWALARREKIFFFPDEHLGRNTAEKMGIGLDKMVVWDPHKPMGGNTERQIKEAVIILWKGYCLVHTRFTVAHIQEKRDAFPGALVVTHPECTREVIQASDAVGSTSFIVKFAQQAPPGSTVIIGTEINLIRRLATEHPDKTILPLHESLCPNMAKITLEKLLQTLENPGTINLVSVPSDIKQDARTALDNMLRLTS